MLNNDLFNKLKLDRIAKELVDNFSAQTKEIEKIIRESGEKHPTHSKMISQALAKAKEGDFVGMTKIVERLKKL